MLISSSPCVTERENKVSFLLFPEAAQPRGTPLGEPRLQGSSSARAPPQLRFGKGSCFSNAATDVGLESGEQPDGEQTLHVTPAAKPFLASPLLGAPGLPAPRGCSVGASVNDEHSQMTQSTTKGVQLITKAIKEMTVGGRACPAANTPAPSPAQPAAGPAVAPNAAHGPHATGPGPQSPNTSPARGQRHVNGGTGQLPPRSQRTAEPTRASGTAAARGHGSFLTITD